jgi:DNA-binding NtrC family response regulator
MNAHRHTILLVEDDASTRRGLEALLKAAGYHVVGASDFGEGRRALTSVHPDLVLTDIRLGEFNGLQLVALSPVPIPSIVVTGFADPVLEEAAHKLGAVFVLKPIVPSDLLELVAQKLAHTSPSPA